MRGDLPFERLSDEGKKKALLMIGEAIEAYILDLKRKQQ